MDSIFSLSEENQLNPILNNNINEKANTIGVVFSGGGIRSASFCSGVLSGILGTNLIINNDNISKDKDLIFSCVSGGGYIGSGFCQRVAKKCNEPEATNINKVRTDAYQEMHERILKHPSYLFRSGWWKLVDVPVFVLILIAILIIMVIKLLPFAFLISETLVVIEKRIGETKMKYSILVFWGSAVVLEIVRKLLKTFRPRKSRNRITLHIKNILRIFSFVCIFIGNLVSFVFINSAIGENVNAAGQKGIAISAGGFSIITFLLSPSITSKSGMFLSTAYGWVVFLFFTGSLTYTRYIGKSNYILGLIPYSHNLYKYFFVVNIIILIFYELLSRYYHGLLRYYYTKYLTKLFYANDKNSRNPFALAKCTFDDLHPKTSYISNMKTNAWVSSANSSSHGILSIGKFKSPTTTHPKSETQIKLFVPLKNKFTKFEDVEYITKDPNSFWDKCWDVKRKVGEIKVCDAMANSAAAVAPTKIVGGHQEMMKLLGVGQGEWFNMTSFWFRFLQGLFWSTIIFIYPLVSIFLSNVGLDIHIALYLLPWILIVILSCFGDVFETPLFFNASHSSIIKDMRHTLSVPIFSKKLVSAYLSDGGHIENTGLMAMLHYIDLNPDTINTIYMADGAEDGDRSCPDLKKVLEMARLSQWSFSPLQIENNLTTVSLNNDANIEIQPILLNDANIETLPIPKITDVNLQILNFINNDKRRTLSLKASKLHYTVNIHFMKPIRGDKPPYHRWGFELLWGKYPNTSTGYQFFSKDQYTYYCSEGRACFDTINQQNQIN